MSVGVGVRGASLRLFTYVLVLGVFALFGLSGTQPAAAATGINQQINFQGRLLNQQGATVPDGFYNIQFKIYQDGDGQSVGNTTGSPSGVLKWTESHLNNNSQGVQVKNGFMSVQLGSVTAFGSSIDWNQDTLWLSMNIGNTNTTCTPFSSCSPDGEMVPMKRLSSSPYAINSGQLGGLTSSQFVQIAQGAQTDSSNTNTIDLNKTGSGNFLNLQASSDMVFALTNAGNVFFGNNANHTISIETAATNVAGKSLTISGGDAGGGTAANGGNITLQGGNAAGTGDADGGTITLQAGNDIGSGETGQVIIQAGSGDRNEFLSVRNSAGTPMLIVNSTNGELYLDGNISATHTSYDVTFSNDCCVAGGTKTIGVETADSGDGLNLRLLAASTESTNDDGGSVILSGGDKNGAGIAGGVTVQNVGDSANAFRVLTAGGAAMLQIDSSGNIIKVGDSTGTDTATTIFRLDSASADVTTSLSTKNGGLYYTTAGSHGIKAIINGAVADVCTTASVCTGYGSTTGFIQLQASTPGTAQTGHFNITGTGILTTLQTQDQSAASTNSSTLTIRSGNATGTTSNSGNLVLDVGTATGTLGSITIGHAGVSTTIVGSTQIGSSTTDGTQTNLQLDSSNSATDTGTCSTTTNQGALYYNTAMGSLRGCINGSWGDISNPDTLGLLTFGIVPSTGDNPYDLPSLVTAGVTGPCKVSWLDANTVRVAACIAYSSGRRINITQTDLDINNATFPHASLTTTNLWGHVCLIPHPSTGVYQAAFTNVNGATTPTANMPTFSISAPTLCLASVKNSTGTNATIDDLYDVRTFTSTIKEAVNLTTAADLGMLVDAASGGLVPAVCGGTTCSGKLYGAVVATDGSTSSSTPNAVVAAVGPAYIKAVAGTAGQFIQTSSTNGYATTVASIPNNAFYFSPGNTRTSFSTTCSAASNCLGSLYVNFIVR